MAVGSNERAERHMQAPWLGTSGPRHQALATVRSHLRTEEVGSALDVDEIMATVSADPWFVTVAMAAGPPALVTFDTTERVREFYVHRGADIFLQQSISQVVGDFFVVDEMVSESRRSGMGLADDDPTGKTSSHAVVLFPTAADGIIGELFFVNYFGQPGPEHTVTRDIVSSSTREATNGELLDATLDGLRDKDFGDVVTADHPVAVCIDTFAGRHVVQTPAATDARASLRSLVDGADDVALVTRVATEWYAFGEYVASYDGGARFRDLVLLHPVTDGRLGATLGYGRERASMA